MIVRRAIPGDAAALAELGARTFIDAFGAQNRPEDMAAYVAATYASMSSGRFCAPKVSTNVRAASSASAAASEVVARRTIIA